MNEKETDTEASLFGIQSDRVIEHESPSFVDGAAE